MRCLVPIGAEPFFIYYIIFFNKSQVGSRARRAYMGNRREPIGLIDSREKIAYA